MAEGPGAPSNPEIMLSAASTPAVLGGPTVTFDFHATAGGALLAQARVIDFRGASGPCNPVQFSIRGRRETPLIGGSFLEQVQRLLGVRLNPAPASVSLSHLDRKRLRQRAPASA